MSIDKEYLEQLIQPFSNNTTHQATSYVAALNSAGFGATASSLEGRSRFREHIEYLFQTGTLSSPKGRINSKSAGLSFDTNHYIVISDCCTIQLAGR